MTLFMVYQKILAVSSKNFGQKNSSNKNGMKLLEL